MKLIGVLAPLMLVLTLAGCGRDNISDSLKAQIDELRTEQLKLKKDLAQAQAQYEQADKQIEVISTIDRNVRIDSLYQLTDVKLGNYTGLFDKDKDGTKETLIVYLQPIDDVGDIIKAKGKVNIELWDLSKEGYHAKLGEWSLENKDLKTKWITALFTNYKLSFDVSDIAAASTDPLTVKAKFTDYLSGKVFEKQALIEP